jgi:hypothetical protein
MVGPEEGIVKDIRGTLSRMAETSTVPLDKSGTAIRDMFAGVAL